MWNQLQKQVQTLTQDLQHKLVDCFSRMVSIEQHVVSKNADGIFDQQVLSPGQVVHVNFIGLGSVMNGPHYGLIFDCSPKMEHVIVLPLTSKVNSVRSNVDLGPIPGLPSPINVVKTIQPQSVSRQSIELLNYHGQQVSVTPEQMLKVRNALRLSVLKERSLSEVLFHDIDAYIPVSVSDDVLELLQLPVVHTLRVSGNTAQFSFQCTENGEMKGLPMIKLRMKFAQRRELLINLLSSNADTRRTAEQAIQQLALAQGVITAQAEAAATSQQLA